MTFIVNNSQLLSTCQVFFENVFYFTGRVNNIAELTVSEVITFKVSIDSSLMQI